MSRPPGSRPAALLAACALAIPAASAHGVTPQDLIGLVDVGVPAVSPDGRLVAIETRRADLERNAIAIRWLIIDLHNRPPRRIVDAGDGGEPIIAISRGLATGVSLPQKPQWSPDAQWIAYRLQRTGEIQVWRSRVDGSVQHQLTHSPHGVDAFCWSRDGATLIYADSPARQAFEQSLRTEADRGYLYDERFAPFNDRAPLFDPGPDPARESHVLDLETGVERVASADEARACDPRTTPLLKDVRPDRSLGINPPLTVVVPDPRRANREAVCRVAECTGYFSGAWLSEEGKAVDFLRWVNGRDYGPLAMYRWPVGSPRVTEQWRTNDLIQHCEQHRRKLICAHESATTPRKLISITLDQRVHDNGRFTAFYDPNLQFKALSFGEVTPLIWHDAHGVEGFGHLVKPIGYQPGRRYPLVIVQYRSRGFLRGGVGDEYPIPVFSANGFAVLSFDRPEDPELEARVKDYDELEARANEDLRDRKRVHSVLLAGIDTLVESGLIDPERVGITGLSDGAESVAFALVHASPRFAAASASWTLHAPTFYYVAGPKFQPLLTRWHFGDPRGAAADQWQRASLALNARSVVTPLLLQVSEQELLPETETVAALNAWGKPVEMHVFPGEAHVKTQPRHRLHLYRRNLQWFQFWLQGIEASDPVDARQYERWRALRAFSHTSAARHASSDSN